MPCLLEDNKYVLDIDLKRLACDGSDRNIYFDRAHSAIVEFEGKGHVIEDCSSHSEILELDITREERNIKLVGV